MYAATTKSKYWSGQICPKTAAYGQYRDTDNSYAGKAYDRYIQKGERFPPSLNNHHFEEK
ncbi:MAG: hypothetical protein R3D66_05400 [Alphaproteobacteria bacterium]